MVQDTTADHMVLDEGPSQIKNFYENSTVLVTGGLGLIGRLTVEKILRSCPGVARLYLIVRPKKEKTPQERLDDLFNDIVFTKLLVQHPNFRTKVSLVNGDLEKENLGISDEDEKMLINEVNIVLHVAATMRFDEKLRKATYINIRAVRDILFMAKKMPNLKSFVHVSTAYSHCLKNEVDELFYETPITGDNLINFVNVVDDEYLNSLTPSLIGKWPNTYTYTKAIAELSVREHGKGLPISIVRPSIIVPTAKEPVEGWINNFYGMIGLMAAVALGVIRTVYCDPSLLVDTVPADYTANSILAASWAMGRAPCKIKSEEKNNIAFDELNVQDDVAIFNYVSTPENPITNGKYMSLTMDVAAKYPSMHCMWYMTLRLDKHLFVHKIYSFLLHLIPGYIADAILYIIGKKPIVVKSYAKAQIFLDTIGYFLTRQWIFKNNNVQTLWAKLSKADKAIFEFSMANLDWKSYIETLVKEGRFHVLKDSLDTIPQARKKYFKLKVAHYSLVYLFYLGLAYLFWKILSAYLF